MKRRRFKQTITLKERLAAEAKRLREEANLLPAGAAREELFRKAQKAETAVHLNEWLGSPAMRGIVERNWPHVISKLPPQDADGDF